ncbi:tyrosine-type recombinase/integrase [Candidatus Enterovibrio altilux]|uniref:tyrosine-type recombinase/integrase n=1 Tax=Candidatus Enterovibrio altilux TaxID=1927128 RepID=UPI001CC26D82
MTDLVTKGISVRVLAALTGHQSIATTQRYIDVNNKMLKMLSNSFKSAQSYHRHFVCSQLMR